MARAKVFSCDFCEISSNTFSSRILAVTGSGSDCAQCYWDHGIKPLANLNKQIVASTSNL